jgi:glycosyltransferase involved in cell wall biosynthesis
MTPQVTVIVPCCPWRPSAVRAINSALHQTIEDVEVIVVDDGTVPGGHEATLLLADRRVEYILHPEDDDLGPAENTGILMARAHYVAFLDPADELMANSLEERLRCLEENPDSPLVYSRLHYVVSKKTIVELPRQPIWMSEEFIDALILEGGLLPSTMMARTAALMLCKFDPEIDKVADWDVALSLARLGPVSFVEHPLTIVRAAENVIEEDMDFEIEPASATRLIAEHLDAFRASPRAEAAVLYRAALSAVKHDFRELAYRYLERIVELDPEPRKAKMILRLYRLGMLPLLPPLMRLRWKALQAARKAPVDLGRLHSSTVRL